MPRLAAARSGRRVQVKKREVDFSFWPSKPGLRHHYGLQSRLFAPDPWAVIRQTIQSECNDTRRDEALAALEQAEGFYFMGTDAEVGEDHLRRAGTGVRHAVEPRVSVVAGFGPDAMHVVDQGVELVAGLVADLRADKA
jgi:hypothetical protein